jgi:hypothetical protein
MLPWLLDSYAPCSSCLNPHVCDSNMWSTFRIALFAPGLLVLGRIALAQQCYYPDQSPINATACFPGVDGSACCPEGAYCLSSGLCFFNGQISRVGCTDKTFASENCPRYCLGKFLKVSRVTRILTSSQIIDLQLQT